MTDYTHALKVLQSELDRAYVTRDYHRLEGQRGSIELAAAGFRIEWLRSILHQITGNKPTKR
jgi:hypothetical protein